MRRLVAALRAGAYLDVAARASGVDVDALDDHPELLERIATARAEGEVASVAVISQAARSNWQAAAWLLEREYPDRWGRPAVRPVDESAPPLLDGSDSLDELARRRDERRADR